MKTFTDDEMNQLLPTARPYSVVILKQGPKFGDEAAPAIVWEHGRRNFGLRDEGVLAVVLPVTDGSDVCGIGVFAATVDDTTVIMNEDPGVAAGMFTYEVHPCRGFPGDALPCRRGCGLRERGADQSRSYPTVYRRHGLPASSMRSGRRVCAQGFQWVATAAGGPFVRHGYTLDAVSARSTP